jgi:CRISPR-associated protein Csb1
VAYDIAGGVRPSSRIDPVVSEGVDIFARADGPGWTADPAAAKTDATGPVKYGKKGKVSELNLGNVTPSLGKDDENPNHGGVTMAYAEQTTVLSLAALRRLRFPIAGQSSADQAAIDDAARTLLAALGMAAICALDLDGFDLRSRCLLDGKPGAFALVGRGEEQPFELNANQAFDLVGSAADRAVKLGLPWPTTPVTLKPSAELRLLVLKSRQRSMAAAAE